jgi:hypothetical protein
MLMFPTLIAIPWRVSCCGGITAVGGKDCGGDPNDFDKWKCLCGHNKNEKMNYYYYHALVDCIKRHRAHLSGSTPLWETIQTELYTTYFKGFMKVTIQTLKDRWKMIQSETRKKFDLSNGFDTHPELKPFDRLVLSLMKEIEAEESKRIVTARDSAAVTEKTNLTRSVIVPVNAKVKQVNAELYRMREKGAAETSSLLQLLHLLMKVLTLQLLMPTPSVKIFQKKTSILRLPMKPQRRRRKEKVNKMIQPKQK